MAPQIPPNGMSLLKIEAFAGVSGDMFLGALSELAGAHEEIQALPGLLGLQDEVEVSIHEVKKCGIACRQVKVRERPHAAHTHHDHDHVHVHVHVHDHDHHHPQGKQGHHPGHPHRRLAEINQLIETSPLTGGAKSIAKEIFLLLGQAESQIHGVELDQIHFHEVGAWDSITDIVGAAFLLDRLQVSETYCTPVTTGSGFAHTEHGRLPVPCPATKALLQGMPTVPGEIPLEMTTPTGAAILRYLNPSFHIPVLIDEAVGYGPGERDLAIPNVVRMSLCRRSGTTAGDTLFQVQSNIDDMKGEYLGHSFQEGLLQAGARDFHLEQVIMKKGRPGVVLNAICAGPDLTRVCHYILEQTSTIGLRYFPIQRMEAPRSSESVAAFGRQIEVKNSTTPSGRSRRKAASDSVLEIAKEFGISPLEVEEQISRKAGRGDANAQEDR